MADIKSVDFYGDAKKVFAKSEYDKGYDKGREDERKDWKCAAGELIMKYAGDIYGALPEAVKEIYQQGRMDAIDECIKFLLGYFGVDEAKKYGNKTKEQLEMSYGTRMNYEIREGIEELAELKAGEQNV